MAEIAAKARPDLSRAALKRVAGGRDGRFPWLELLTPDTVLWYDDFMGDQLDDRYNLSNGGGASAADPAVNTGKVNGEIQLVTGTAGDSTASSDLSLGLHYQGQLGAIIAVRLKLSAITNVKVEVGFTDVLTDAGAVATKATPTFTATDCALWVFDTADNVYWEGIGAATGDTTPMTTVEAAISPVADTYETLVVALQEYDDTNSYAAAKFLRFDANGRKTYESAWATGSAVPAISSNVSLTPWVYVESRDATSKTLYVDSLHVWQRRTQN